MSIINQVLLTNTFDEWRIATNSIANSINKLVNEDFNKLQGSLTIDNGSIVISNGAFSVSGTATFSNNIVAQGQSISIPVAVITVGNRITTSNIQVSNVTTANILTANVISVTTFSANNITANNLTANLITSFGNPVLTTANISSSVSSTSTANVASSAAVKQAYDKAIEALSSGSNQTAVYINDILLTPAANLNFKNTESISVLAQLNAGNVDLEFKANNIDFGLSSGEIVFKGDSGLQGNSRFKYVQNEDRLIANNITSSNVTSNNFTVIDNINITSSTQSFANPSIRFGNNNSGIYLKSPNVVAITANTIDMLTVSNTAITATSEIRSNRDIVAFFASDKRLKENIANIENALEKVLMLNGVRFDWKQNYLEDRGGEDGYFVRKSDIGLLAQEVEKILPEIVATRNDGYLAIKYELIIPLLVEAIKEQSKIIQALEKTTEDRVEHLLRRIEALEL